MTGGASYPSLQFAPVRLQTLSHTLHPPVYPTCTHSCTHMHTHAHTYTHMHTHASQPLGSRRQRLRLQGSAPHYRGVQPGKRHQGREQGGEGSAGHAFFFALFFSGQCSLSPATITSSLYPLPLSPSAPLPLCPSAPLCQPNKTHRTTPPLSAACASCSWRTLWRHAEVSDVYVCIYVCIYVYINVYIYMFIYIYMFMYTCINVSRVSR